MNTTYSSAAAMSSKFSSIKSRMMEWTKARLKQKIHERLAQNYINSMNAKIDTKESLILIVFYESQIFVNLTEKKFSNFMTLLALSYLAILLLVVLVFKVVYYYAKVILF